MPRGVFRKASGLSSSPVRPPSNIFLRPEDLPKERRPYGLPDLVLGLQGRLYTPQGLFVQTTTTGTHPHINDSSDSEESSDNEEDKDVITRPDMAYEKQQDKKRRQWKKWSEHTIPAMLKPYLELLRTTDSFSRLDQVRNRLGCRGCEKGRMLEISCIYFERIEIISVCTCTEAALQLLQLGLFPCAPTFPTLAVDLNMLDFAKGLFVNASPNITAWCETLEGFLSARKFKLTTRDSLRGRFGAALHWYATLVDTKRLCLRNYLSHVRDNSFQALNAADDDDVVMGSPISDHKDGCNDADGEEDVDNGENVTDDGEEDVDDGEDDVDDGQGYHSQDSDTNRENEDNTRPSDYLRERCPLCFGGSNWSSPEDIADVIVCLDACFTQKRQKPKGRAWQAPREHPETVFVSKEDADDMERLVESIRPSVPAASRGKNKSRPGAKPSDQEVTETPPSETGAARTEPDDYEPNIRVPISVLEGCKESFAAADANRVKASTKFFADTGLMAMLCRHDRVLWMVNMKSAGEKQFYALCLLKKLFEHIPESMRVGCLYDIGCQLHRSCEKFQFLSDYLDRITFGISVFHAYGHQWPCQVIYHPRKCEGFGLTDGEGCERFWSSIKGLIPSLRVSGFYTRLYTLDTQVRHLDEKSLLGLANWLHKKWASTAIRKSEANSILEEVYIAGTTMEELRTEWDLQVIEQTKPLKRQSKDLADQEIHSIIAIMQNVEEYKRELARYDYMIDNDDCGEQDIQEVQILKEEVSAKLKNSQKSIAKRKAKLSIDGRLSLEKLLGDQFLMARMNALALKQRIRERLRNRKFELETLERAYRATVNKAKLDNNAKQQIKRKEPGIQALARKYNKACDSLQVMIDQRLAPLGARAPVRIESDGLFKLDVDDDIWQDIGLTDDSDDSDLVPRWLGDDIVRKGIKALLEYDRCIEEERRLSKECIAMEQWITEEWETCNTAIAATGHDIDLLYLLNQHKEHLTKLCVYWMPKIKIIRKLPVDCFLSWGPSRNELRIAQEFEKVASVTSRNATRSNDDNDSESSDEEYNDNAAVIDALEASALVEEFRFVADYSVQAAEFRGLSPVKRGRY